MYENGDVVRQKELSGMGSVDPMRITTLINEIVEHIKPGDVVCIESPATHAKGQGVGFMWGLAYGIRSALYRKGIKYYDVAPTALKKFCDASRNRYDADGNKLDSKAAVADGVYEHWGYTHPSNNVIDGYVLAQIAYALTVDPYERAMNYKGYQIEVIETILKPASEKKADKKEAAKKKKERAEVKAAGKPTDKKPRRKPAKPELRTQTFAEYVDSL
jgi:crossover junction endodeoxyribonuclease RuvC